jgi:hypothetical protein
MLAALAFAAIKTTCVHGSPVRNLSLGNARLEVVKE